MVFSWKKYLEESWETGITVFKIDGYTINPMEVMSTIPPDPNNPFIISASAVTHHFLMYVTFLLLFCYLFVTYLLLCIVVRHKSSALAPHFLSLMKHMLKVQDKKFVQGALHTGQNFKKYLEEKAIWGWPPNKPMVTKWSLYLTQDCVDIKTKKFKIKEWLNWVNDKAGFIKSPEAKKKKKIAHEKAILQMENDDIVNKFTLKKKE